VIAKLFEKFFAKLHLVPGEIHQPVSLEGRGCWWDDPDAIPLAAGRGFNVSLVGELQWQDNISAVVGGRCEGGHNCQVPAQLAAWEDPRDPHSVIVLINGKPVGWLHSDLSDDVRRSLAGISPGGMPVTCKAKIVGGWDRGRRDRGYFGVKLSLSWPLKVHASRARTIKFAAK
jgi:hypothetical protein